MLTRIKLWVILVLCWSGSLLWGSPLVSNQYPLDTKYHKAEQLFPVIEQLCRTNPSLARWEILGFSGTEKLPIYAIRISAVPDSIEWSAPRILVTGQHHGEEVVGVEISLSIAQELLANYRKKPSVTALLNKQVWWIVPTCNPEAFRIVNSGIYSLKRKNNRDTNHNGKLDLETDGVDLNKNYSFHWDTDKLNNSSSPYYKGPSPASESEIKAMQQFFARERFQLAFSYHSSESGKFSEKIFYPWRFNKSVSPDYYSMQQIAQTMVTYLPRDFVSGNYKIAGGENSEYGFDRDFLYAHYGTFAYTIETCGINTEGKSVIQPPNAILDKLCVNHTKAALAAAAEFQKRLFIGRIIDKQGTGQESIRINFPTMKQAEMQEITTNKKGYFFRYVATNSLPVTINRNIKAQFKAIPNRVNLFTLGKGTPKIANRSDYPPLLLVEKGNWQESLPLLVQPYFKGSSILMELRTMSDSLLWAHRQKVDSEHLLLPFIPMEKQLRCKLSIQLLYDNKVVDSIETLLYRLYRKEGVFVSPTLKDSLESLSIPPAASISGEMRLPSLGGVRLLHLKGLQQYQAFQLTLQDSDTGNIIWKQDSSEPTSVSTQGGLRLPVTIKNTGTIRFILQNTGYTPLLIKGTSLSTNQSTIIDSHGAKNIAIPFLCDFSFQFD